MARFARCDVRRRAAVFVGSDETSVSQDQLCEAFRRLLLQIGGADTASADRASEHAYFVVARGRKACALPPYTLLAPLAEAGAREPLPSSLARRRKACLLAHSSRTAPRQPGSARRVARSGLIVPLAMPAVSNGSLRSLRCSPGNRRLRRIRRNE